MKMFYVNYLPGKFNPQNEIYFGTEPLTEFKQKENWANKSGNFACISIAMHAHMHLNRTILISSFGT